MNYGDSVCLMVGDEEADFARELKQSLLEGCGGLCR